MKKYLDALETKIVTTYESGVTMDEAEKLAAEFLVAQIRVSTALKDTDLDARMLKTGVKAIKAGVYLEEASKGEKKPSDVLLGALVDKNAIVQQEQDKLDASEVTRDELTRYFNVFSQAHIHFRSIAKGSFGG